VSQPDNNLVVPAMQLRNFQLGQDWIAATFGVRSDTAWHADSFGHSVAVPICLNQLGLHYVFMGRGRGLGEQRRRTSLFPHAFYWASPADPTQRVLAVYMFYSDPPGGQSISSLAWTNRSLQCKPSSIASLRSPPPSICFCHLWRFLQPAAQLARHG
jgi:hypothetical protein